MKKFSYTLIALGTTSLLAVSLSACSADETTKSNTPAPDKPTVSATPIEVAEADTTYDPLDYGINPDNNEKFGISASNTWAEDSYGKYQLVNISEDSSVYFIEDMKYSDDVLKIYSQEILSEMHHYSVDFVLKNMMDGPAAVDGSYEQFVKHFRLSSPLIARESLMKYEEHLLTNQVKASDGVSQLMKMTEMKGVKVLYDPGYARYSLISIEQGDESIRDGDGITHSYHVVSRRPIEYEDGTKGYIESDAHYSLTLVPASNEPQPFKISDWNNNRGTHNAYLLDGTIVASSEVK